MDVSPRIAIDAMGGDIGPAVIIAGMARARRKDRALRFDVYGDEPIIAAELAKHRPLIDVVTIHHTNDSIEASEKPSQAIRRAKTTSMGLAINAVKEGDAHAALSAGNTGALMAMAKLALRTMPGIDRPALAALLPSLGAHDLVMLDLGANTECDAQNLVQFAVMGAAYARTVLGIAKPRVRLLNIGTEELKGTGELKEAAALLREAKLSADALRRLHRGRQIVARRCRRRRHRRLFGQYRAEDRRGHRALRHRLAAPRLHLVAALEGRLRAVEAGAQPAQDPPRPQ